MDTRENTN